MTVARDSACREEEPRRPMSAAIAELIRLAGPPEMINHIMINIFVTTYDELPAPDCDLFEHASYPILLANSWSM